MLICLLTYFKCLVGVEGPGHERRVEYELDEEEEEILRPLQGRIVNIGEQIHNIENRAEVCIYYICVLYSFSHTLS